MSIGGRAIECLVCRNAAERARALPEWDALVRDPEVSCGFWCDPAVAGGTVRFDGGESLVLVRVTRGEELVGVLPFKRTVGPVPVFLGLLRLGAVKAALLRLSDYEFAVRPGHDRRELLVAVLGALREKRMGDAVLADNCALEEGRWPAAWRRDGVAVRNRQPTYVVEMPPDFATYLAGRSANTRQTLRRRIRNMEKECGPLTARCFRTETEMDDLARRLAEVWKGSWHGRLNRQPPPDAGFLREMARAGWVRSYVLFTGGAPVASVLGYQYKGAFLEEAPAYAQRWGRFSPGLVLDYLMLEDLFREDRPRVVDFGFGYNQYKEMLGTRREWRGQVWMPVTGRGRMLVGAMRVCDGVYGLGKRVLDGTGVLRRLKARVRSRE